MIELIKTYPYWQTYKHKILVSKYYMILSYECADGGVISNSSMEWWLFSAVITCPAQCPIKKKAQLVLSLNGLAQKSLSDTKIIKTQKRWLFLAKCVMSNDDATSSQIVKVSTAHDAHLSALLGMIMNMNMIGMCFFLSSCLHMRPNVLRYLLCGFLFKWQWSSKSSYH